MTVDHIALIRAFQEVLAANRERSDRVIAQRLSDVLIQADVEYENFPFVAVYRRHSPRYSSVQATFRYAEACRLYAEAHKLLAETRDGRKLAQNYDSRGYAHGTKILDILEDKQ